MSAVTPAVALPPADAAEPPADDPADLPRLLLERRSTKAFLKAPLSVGHIASALWAVAGQTGDGHRVVPSARGSYPIVATLVAGSVEGLRSGAYRYDTAGHTLVGVDEGEHGCRVADSTLEADWLATCPALILLSADLHAARRRFPDQPPEHGERFVWIEVGHAAQNLYLWAARHRLGTALIAGIDDDAAATTCAGLLPRGHRLLGILPLGQPAPESASGAHVAPESASGAHVAPDHQHG